MLKIFLSKAQSLASYCVVSSYLFFLFFSENCKIYLGMEEKAIEQLPLYHITRQGQKGVCLLLPVQYHLSYICKLFFN